MKRTSTCIRVSIPIAILLLLSACAGVPEAVVSEPEPVSTAAVKPLDEPTPVPVPVEPKSLPKPVKLAEPSSVAIVLTSRQPVYEDVAIELGKRLEHYTIYDMSDKSQPAVSAFRLINDSDTGAVIAIGLSAARSSVAMSTSPVVFSQVFNHQDHNLITENSRGVSAIAPLKAQLAAWRAVDPDIKRIGAIIGNGHDDLIAKAQLAAKDLGLTLIVREVSSDQEALYHFRRLVRNIDGFWLFPDNRVLSTRSLHEIIEQAQQRQVPVSVQNESLLALGATMSVATVASDIAETIVKIVRMIEAGRIQNVPAITSLSETRVIVNTRMAMH